LQTIAASTKRNGIYVRFWMSAGRGDFNVAPKFCTGTTFYCAVHEAGAPKSSTGVREQTVDVPLKSVMLATTKTTNYLVNALAAMEGLDKGGTLGMQCDEDGNVAECSIGSVGVVFEDGVLRTPKLDKILKSTTLIRATQLWKKGGVPLQDFVFTDIPLERVWTAKEVIGFGGGSVTPIIDLNGKPIGNGKPGPVFLKLKELLDKDATEGEFVDIVPYTN
jgi:branched-subunit amino acid aminotransferase/4-amino-4-deoxychorismate lyase